MRRAGCRSSSGPRRIGRAESPPISANPHAIGILSSKELVSNALFRNGKSDAESAANCANVGSRRRIVSSSFAPGEGAGVTGAIGRAAGAAAVFGSTGAVRLSAILCRGSVIVLARSGFDCLIQTDAPNATITRAATNHFLVLMCETELKV
jgi:hypothetical protein